MALLLWYSELLQVTSLCKIYSIINFVVIIQIVLVAMVTVLPCVMYHKPKENCFTDFEVFDLLQKLYSQKF